MGESSEGIGGEGGIVLLRYFESTSNSFACDGCIV